MNEESEMVHLNGFKSEKASAAQTYNPGMMPSHNVHNGLKDELKQKIIINRKRRGLHDIEINKDVPRKYEMTPEEREKDQKRRKSNRASALRSRKKQKEEEKIYEQLHKQFEERNMDLEVQVSKLEREKAQLISKLARLIPADRVQRHLENLANNTLNQQSKESSVPHKRARRESVDDASLTADVEARDVSNCTYPSSLDSSNPVPAPSSGEGTYIIQIIDSPPVDGVDENGTQLVFLNCDETGNFAQNLVHEDGVTPVSVTSESIVADDKQEIVMYAYELPVQDGSEHEVVYVLPTPHTE